MKWLSVLAFTMSVSVSAFANIDCTPVGATDILNVKIRKSDPALTFEYNKVIVEKTNGAKQILLARTITDLIGPGTTEASKLSRLVDQKTKRLGILEYVFFTRPQDENPTGWSHKNGVKANLYLPGARSEVLLNCDKR